MGNRSAGYDFIRIFIFANVSSVAVVYFERNLEFIHTKIFVAITFEIIFHRILL